MFQQNMKPPYLLLLLLGRFTSALNYTGETALLDAAPSLPNHSTSVTFGELGAFDFRGDGRARVALQLGAFSSEKDAKLHRAKGVLQSPLNDTGPTRDTQPVELDHVYLIFAKSRAVNNFVARLHTLRSDGTPICSDFSRWLDTEYVAPITGLHRPPVALKKDDALKTGGISFITKTTDAVAPPHATRVTGMQKRENPATLTISISSPSSSPQQLLGNEPNDVFLVEYEWEWQVRRGGEYAVVVANCASTTVQFKYNLIMANQWHNGDWTNLPAGWMPVQQVYPAVCYTLWAVAAGLWAAVQLRRRQSVPVLGVVLGFVPVLRFVSCLADQSRYSLWGSASYEATMVVVSTSLVDALADGAHFLVLLAIAKGWGVVRSRLVGSEKRLVSGLVIFVGVATLYDGATRGGGVLAVGVMQLSAVLYARASLSHTRRVHSIQVLRLVSRNSSALDAWAPGERVEQALERLSRLHWRSVHVQSPALGLVWAAVRKERLLKWVAWTVVPLQVVDLVTLFVGSFAIPPHYAYIGLLVTQAVHWIAYMAVFACLLASGMDMPDIGLPALPAVNTRRSIPLPPPDISAMAPRPMPPLGRLRLFHNSAPFMTSATAMQQQ